MLEINVHENWFVNATYTDLEEDHIFIASEGSDKSEETLIYQVSKINDGDDVPSVEFQELSSGDTVKVYETKELADTGLYVSDIEDDDVFDLLNATAGDPDEMNSELITESGMSITLKREANLNVTANDGETTITLNSVEYDTKTTTDALADLAALLVADGYNATEDGDNLVITGFQINTLVEGDNIADFSITTELYFEENADGVFSLDPEVTDELGDLTVTVDVDTDDEELELSWTDNYFEEVQNTETDMEYAVSTLGTYYEADDDEKAYLNIWTPMEGQTVYNVYVAEADSISSSEGSSALGDVLVKDTEVDSVKAKNLIIVGGSCINSAAANVLGVPERTCGEAFTAATTVSAGQFLIKSVSDAYTTDKVAVVVAGYNVADTNNAATYLRTQKPAVDAGQEYIGTSSTEATLQVE